MAPLPMSVTFLGTSSGGGPSLMRNCSSLLADVQSNGQLWMVDCAEGTTRQFQFQPQPAYGAPDSRVKIQKVEKIFITHMHADHIMGIIPVLRNVLYPPPNPALEPRPRKEDPAVEIYGPKGIREFVRANMKMTFTNTADRYVVHELLTATDEPTSCMDEDRHGSEDVGKDIRCDAESTWRGFISTPTITVDAGPIHHREPCLGFIFRRIDVTPERTIAILGDTFDPTPITQLLTAPHAPPELLIHEATDAYIPNTIDPRASRDEATVAQAALFRGHSTPVQAGQFARLVGAKRLVLNHIGSRFVSPGPNMGYRAKEIRQAVLLELERQAGEAWGAGMAAAVAHDFMRVTVPLNDVVVAWPDEEPNMNPEYLRAIQQSAAANQYTPRSLEQEQRPPRQNQYQRGQNERQKEPPREPREHRQYHTNTRRDGDRREPQQRDYPRRDRQYGGPYNGRSHSPPRR
ncbi:Metallo-hydrolase/oxidoreductase [Cylindrobasidium torrendii FP15055 ss-10]|uniref:Metallo-hydrolase/oxidoreductase n=1 Tax=Cylindrobasidium torrendii FP15055 ss-10 TaxID=1314674 RepID=A0A0D7B6Y0_9AGAR|nr:Metallo-hydrolase/oxidoreductase [Cylindrobasidium torrendii FP15055 ss-10]